MRNKTSGAQGPNGEAEQTRVGIQGGGKSRRKTQLILVLVFINYSLIFHRNDYKATFTPLSNLILNILNKDWYQKFKLNSARL